MYRCAVPCICIFCCRPAFWSVYCKFHQRKGAVVPAVCSVHFTSMLAKQNSCQILISFVKALLISVPFAGISVNKLDISHFDFLNFATSNFVGGCRYWWLCIVVLLMNLGQSKIVNVLSWWQLTFWLYHYFSCDATIYRKTAAYVNSALAGTNGFWIWHRLGCRIDLHCGT